MSHELREFLTTHGLEECYERLAAENVDLDVLPSLSESDFQEIGFKLGERKRLTNAITKIGVEQDAPAMPAERRNLTVAFCDLVGSTSLASVLDPEDLRGVITQYLDVAVETMRAFGGHLAYTQGDGLMIYFGYPQAREDDASQAIRAGLATVDAVNNIVSKAPNGLKVRVGVATGRVVVGDMVGDATAPKDFVVGETPNLAARLQALANPGEVLVADQTYKLSSGMFDFKYRGVQELKGFDKPRAVYAVTGELNAKSRFEARAADGLRRILGRDGELASLEAMWAQCAEGKGGIALIEGPAGIGKSRLIRSLFNNAGGAALEWQCAPHLSNRALHPIAGELRRAAGIQRSDDAEVLKAKATALAEPVAGYNQKDTDALISLVGAWSEDAGELDALELARRSREVIMRRVFGTTRSGRAIVILEDAHWADPMTLELLEAIAERIVDVPLLLLVTYRPEYVPSPVLQAAATHIQLSPLSLKQSKKLMDLVTDGKGLPDALARRVLEKADGIPLYIEEITKAVLAAFPDPFKMQDEALEKITVPATLQDSLMARLDRMGPAKEIAQLAALIGREFTLSMVDAIAPKNLDVKRALNELEEAGILHRGGLSGPDFYVFNHALVQDTAYESMLRSRRHTLHEALAKTMLREHDAFGTQEPETIARHCELGGLTEDAIEQWTKAGHDAMSRASNLSAVTHLNAALRLLAQQPEGPARDGTELGLQMSLMPAAMSIYGWGAREVEVAAFRARDLAGQLNDGAALYGATWGVWTMHFLRGEMGDCLKTAHQSDAMANAIGAPMLLTTADHAVTYSQLWMGDFEPALKRSLAGIPRHDPQVEAEIISNFQLSSTLNLHVISATAHWALGHEDESAKAHAGIIPFAESLNHKPSLAYGYGGLGHSLAMQHEWDHLAEIADRCHRLAEEEGYILWLWVSDVHKAAARSATGNDPEKNLADLISARERFLTTGSRVTDLVYFPLIGDLMTEIGKPQEAFDFAQQGLKQAEVDLEKATYSELYRMRGRANHALGNADAAAKDFAAALAVARAQGAVPFIKRAEADAKVFCEPMITSNN